MEKVSILITGVGAPGAPSIIRCLRNNKERSLYLVGVDMNSMASSRRLVDSFYQVPSAKQDDFIDSIIDICEKEKVKIIIPLVTRELYAFSKKKKELEKLGIKTLVMEYDTLSIVNNKYKLLQYMKNNNLNTPNFCRATNIEEVKCAIKKIGYPNKPICVKGAEGNGSRGIRIIDPNISLFDCLFNEKPGYKYTSYNSLIEVLEEKDSIPEMMVMDYLSGQEYGIDVLCDNGAVIYMAGRYNSSVNSSIPQCAIIENREEPFNIAKNLIYKLKMSGNINFDFIYENGEPYLIEINPRFSATIASYMPAGLNLPYLGVKYLLGEELPDVSLHEGIKMQRRYIEVYYDEYDNEIEGV